MTLNIIHLIFVFILLCKTGAEAPRNSLEVEEQESSSSPCSSSLKLKQETNYKIPVSFISLFYYYFNYLG